MQERFHMLNKTAVKAVLMAAALLIATAAGAQEQSQKKHEQGGMAGMDMGGGAQKQDASPEASAANDAMSGNMSDHEIALGAHMFMTVFCAANAADQRRAAEILAELRPAIEKYRDYKVALA